MEGKPLKYKYIVLALLAAALFLNALSFRYRIVSVSAGERAGLAYIIDNWTGKLWLCGGVDCQPTITKP